MSKFDELKAAAEQTQVEQESFDAQECRMREFQFLAKPIVVLELLAIQAQLVEALKGLDDSFCSINEFSTKEERHQARMSLMAARAALAAAGAQS